MTGSVENAVYGAPVRRSRMSPEKIRSHTFSRVPLGRRGVSEEEVDQFCGQLAEEVAVWAAENAALRTENDRLKTALRQWQSEQATRRAGVNWKSRKVNGPAGGDQSAGPVRLPSETAQLADQIQREAEAILSRAGRDSEQAEGPEIKPYDAVLREAQRLAELEAERVARTYRSRAGDQYTAEFEELERRLAWATAFLEAIEKVEAKLRAAKQTLAYHVEHFSKLRR